MSLVDAFSKEDRIPVKFSDFYEMVRSSAERDIMLQAIERNVPVSTLQQVFSENPPEMGIVDTELKSGDANVEVQPQ